MKPRYGPPKLRGIPNDCSGHDIRAQIPGRLQEPEREGLGHDGHGKGLPLVGDRGKPPNVFDDAEVVGRLEDDAGHLVVKRRTERREIHATVGPAGHVHGLDAEFFDVCSNDFTVLGMQAFGDHNPGLPRHAVSHEDGFRSPRRSLVEGGVGDIEPGELTDKGLEFEDGLQRSLADFGLIGRIRTDELPARAQVIDDGGNEVFVGPASEKREAAGTGVARADLLERPDEIHLRQGAGQVEVRHEPKALRNGRKETFRPGQAHDLQHLLLVFVAQRQIAHESHPLPSPRTEP
jgi:hypothetical protein